MDGAIPPLVLASRSPRRAQLLEMLGLEFDVHPAEVDEAPRSDEPSLYYVERLAREKAEAVAYERPDALVIGSDTLVVIDDVVLGKPEDEDDAVEILMRLQGREHHVETGIAIMAPDGRLESTVERVRVRFRPFDQRTAEDYVATGEPSDKAGAYGIQGLGATLVEEIEGDYYAVVGLPIARLIGLLRELGWRYDFRRLAPMTAGPCR